LCAFYQSLVKSYPNCSRDIQDRIVYEILELIKQAEPLRSKGIGYYRELKEQIPEEMRRHVLRQLIINLSGTLDEQMRPSLDLIFEDQDILEKEDLIRLIDYLTGQISTAQKEQTQIYAMEYVLRMPNLYRRGGEVLRAVLLVSRSGSQGSFRRRCGSSEKRLICVTHLRDGCLGVEMSVKAY